MVVLLVGDTPAVADLFDQALELRALEWRDDALAGNALHLRQPNHRICPRVVVQFVGVLASGASMRSRIVPRVVEADDGGTDTEEAHAQEVTAESVGRRVQRRRVQRRSVQRRRVPHRPGKRRRGGLRDYTWAELRAVGAWRGRADMPALRRNKAATGSDPGSGLD
jgi:hypothetical protein